MTNEEAIKVLRGMLCTGLDLSPGLLGEEAEAVAYAIRQLEAWEWLRKHSKAATKGGSGE